MITVTLYAVPAPGQCIKGESKFLGTVRTNMHKAPLTALAAGLEQCLDREGVKTSVSIVDMQTTKSGMTKYGELDLDGLMLEKYRVGMPFEGANDSLDASDIVGINSNFTHSRRIASDFALHAKSRNPRAIVVVGGTEATADPVYYLKNGADVVVKGEGELCFPWLIKSIAYGEGLESVPNISYVSGGQIHHNLDTFLNRSSSLNVDAMPPPNLDLVDLTRYDDTGEGSPPYGLSGPFISVETSRGCAQSCSFCATPFAKGRYRFMSLRTIGEHFKYFQSKGVGTLLFQEDNVLSRVHHRNDGAPLFAEGRQELLDMFALARDMGFSWEFTNGLELGRYESNGRIDRELIDTMFWHGFDGGTLRGCYRATLPLENLTDESSRLFRKLKPLGIMKEIIKAIVETGVHSLSFNLIIGRPEDSERELLLSYERCLAIRELCMRTNSNVRVYFNIYVLSLLPGTVDYRKYKDLLAYDLEKDPEVITFYLGSLRTKYFSPLEITQARGTMAKLLNSDALIQDYDENYYITCDRFERLFATADVDNLS